MYEARCESCKYSMTMGVDICCGYIIIEGHMRGCYKGQPCDKYVERSTKRRPKISLDGGFIYFEEE